MQRNDSFHLIPENEIEATLIRAIIDNHIHSLRSEPEREQLHGYSLYTLREGVTADSEGYFAAHFIPPIKEEGGPFDFDVVAFHYAVRLGHSGYTVHRKEILLREATPVYA
jgi:hypothetical protein